MKTLIRKSIDCKIKIILAVLAINAIQLRSGELMKTADELPRILTAAHITHALELFPRERYNEILELKVDVDLRSLVLGAIETNLNMKHKNIAYDLARAVITEANRYDMDPFFLLAVIKTESNFNPRAKGGHGEIGLMQVLPRTAKWLSYRAKLPKNFDLNDPVVNVRVGAFYFSMLRKQFNGIGTRYVAAYNMGARNVYKLMKKNKEPEIYPARVLANYGRFYQTVLASEEVSALRSLHGITRNVASIE